jgi:tetratricopeptide (TPR) repeat protein
LGVIKPSNKQTCATFILTNNLAKLETIKRKMQHRNNHDEIKMEKAFHMNNKGANYIQSGSYGKALETLSDALRVVTKYLEEHTNQDNEDDDLFGEFERSHIERQEAEKPAAVCDAIPTLVKEAVRQDANDALLLDDDDSIDIFVYRRPFRVTSLCTKDDCFALSVVLVFNLALAHHLKAIHDDNNPKRLRVALQLYKLGSSMKHQSNNRRLGIMNTIAVANNCGHIYKQLQRTKMAKEFFQHVLSTLMMMFEYGDDVEVDQLDGFLKNAAAQLILRDPAFAAAA